MIWHPDRHRRPDWVWFLVFQTHLSFRHLSKPYRLNSQCSEDCASRSLSNAFFRRWWVAKCLGISPHICAWGRRCVDSGWTHQSLSLIVKMAHLWIYRKLCILPFSKPLKISLTQCFSKSEERGKPACQHKIIFTPLWFDPEFVNFRVEQKKLS